MNSILIDQLMSVARNKIANYVIPGLNSYLIADNGDKGKIRLFHSTRNHFESITPHSHRFDLSCIVIEGEVTNILWDESSTGDEYALNEQTYNGDTGKYKSHKTIEITRFSHKARRYKEGEIYSMRNNEIHSIYFKRDTRVLFFEGASVSNKSLFIEPIVDGVMIPSMKVEPWMFTKGVTND